MSWLSVNENNELLWAGHCGGESMLKKAQASHPGKNPIPLRMSRENGLEDIELRDVTDRRRTFSHPAAVLK